MAIPLTNRVHHVLGLEQAELYPFGVEEYGTVHGHVHVKFSLGCDQAQCAVWNVYLSHRAAHAKHAHGELLMPPSPTETEGHRCWTLRQFIEQSTCHEGIVVFWPLDKVNVANQQPNAEQRGEKSAATPLANAGEALFALLLESAPDAIVIVDAAGQILLVNDQAEKLFGYSRQEMVGQPVEMLMPQHQRVDHVRQREQYAAQPRTRPMGSGLNLAGLRKDGTTFPVEISLSPFATPDGLLITSIVRDVTERKQAEALIRKLNEDLERRVQERTEQLERANRELVRAEQLAALGQVAAGVAHELRNPLTSIKGLVQVNRREAEQRGMPVEDLRIIELEIRRMERTLQTFLDFARPPVPKRTELSLVPIVENVLALLAGRAAKQHVGVIFNPPRRLPLIQGDRDQLQQLLLNLILNAFDAMPKGGTLTVRIEPTTPNGLRVDVEDTGHGIPAKLLPRIFDPFISSKETGLGLGLAVSRRIAEDHGGSLTASNRLDGGAQFRLELPQS